MLTLSALTSLVALAIAAAVIGGVLERVVTQGIDRRLDAQIALMASSVDANGTIDMPRLAVVRDALSAGRDWSWQISAPERTVGPADFPRLDPELPGPPIDERRRHGGAQPREGRDADDAPVHARELILKTTGGDVRLTASAPREVIQRPIRAAAMPLMLLLAALSAVLAVTAAVQVRLGLRPLRALKSAVAEVRAGRAAAVPDDQPHELAPLAGELNALVRENDAALAAARASAANLAHALKTPVATLALGLRDDPGASRQVARIDAVIRHHLSRTRDRVAGTRKSTVIAPAIADLAATLMRLAGERKVAIDVVIAADLAVAMDPADFDELSGNLIDNAVRHAVCRVVVTGMRVGGMVHLVVEDDGPGIPEASRARALQAGVRLDERGEGHGFGLAIARELAALYGGELILGSASSGGLRAEVRLPARDGIAT
ncbi:histidine kinase [Sphingomonas antarctica]